jgi:hypothetical protein
MRGTDAFSSKNSPVAAVNSMTKSLSLDQGADFLSRNLVANGLNEAEAAVFLGVSFVI